MTEREPKPNIDKRLEGGIPDIPLFEKLDEPSQKFIAEIDDLSAMSEEKFLAKYPKIQNLAWQSKKFWGDKKCFLLRCGQKLPRT